MCPAGPPPAGRPSCLRPAAPPAPAPLHLPFAAGLALMLCFFADALWKACAARVLGPAGGLVSRGKCNVIEK